MKKLNLLNLIILLLLASCGGSDSGGGSAALTNGPNSSGGPNSSNTLNLPPGSEVANLTVSNGAVEYYTANVLDNDNTSHRSFFYYGIVLDSRFAGQLSVFKGEINDYDRTKLGAVKDGSYAESDIVLSTANYKFNQVGQRYLLDFVDGTCNDTYPFKLKLFNEGTPVEFIKTGDFLDVKLSNGDFLRLKKDNFLGANKDVSQCIACTGRNGVPEFPSEDETDEEKEAREARNSEIIARNDRCELLAPQCTFTGSKVNNNNNKYKLKIINATTATIDGTCRQFTECGENQINTGNGCQTCQGRYVANKITNRCDIPDVSVTCEGEAFWDKYINQCVDCISADDPQDTGLEKELYEILTPDRKACVPVNVDCNYIGFENFLEKEPETPWSRYTTEGQWSEACQIDCPDTQVTRNGQCYSCFNHQKVVNNLCQSVCSTSQTYDYATDACL